MIQKIIYFFPLLFLVGCLQQSEPQQNIPIDISPDQTVMTITDEIKVCPIEDLTDFTADKLVEDQAVAEPNDEVVVQGLMQMAKEMAFEGAIMIAVQSGVSMANSAITTQRLQLSDLIAKNSQILQAEMQSFQVQAQTNQQTQLQGMMNAFSKEQQNMQAKIMNAANISNMELNYIYQNISINQPQQNYIFNQIQFDQLFSLGTMDTPAGPLWKNPFAAGDWEYEADSNSFWQYQISPIFTQETDDNNTTTSSSLQSENNSIFAEYFSSQASYEITGSVTFYKISYPFFTGIIFNKARWISGDFEAIRKCRMMGVYGDSADDIGVYFAQQYTMSSEQLAATKSESPIQTPLQQILAKQGKKQINLPSSLFKNMHNEPLTIYFEITNSAATVTCKIWINKNSPTTFVVDKLDPAIFMYHGVGFICPGAIAQFTLTAPQDLVFTPQAILKYKG